MERKTSLTDVQFAYMMGRNTNLYLGGVSTHFYAEFERDFLPDRLEAAINKVIAEQDMLRAYIGEDGTARILDQAPHYDLPLQSLEQMGEEDRNQILLDYRARTADRIFPLGQWPMFAFRLFQLTDTNYRLAADFDMMLVDGMSTEMLIHQILYYYEQDCPVTPLPASFSDYLESQQGKRALYGEADRAFWQERLADFQAGPFLEKREEGAEDIPRFAFLEQTIPPVPWQEREKALKKEKILPSIYLLTAYAKTISQWRNVPKLTINMTVSDRKASGDKDFSRVMGDFTKILPVDFDFSDPALDLYEISRRTQKKIGLYKKHLNCNILSFAKDVCAKDDAEDKTAFPFVFTGMFFDLAKEGWEDFGHRVYQASQTPQVLLDNQITLKSGALTIHWDYPSQYWDRDQLTLMQQYFVETALYGQSAILKETTSAFLAQYNDTREELDYQSPVALIHRQAELYPDDTAVLTKDSEMTYEELDQMSTREAHYLIEKYGCRRGFLIEGWRACSTIVHMLAVAKTGGYYVPIATGLPQKRKDYIREKSCSAALLGDQFYWEADCQAWPDTFETLPKEDKDALLYVIYTSGTTGNPKGVEISRKAMMNTVMDMNQRFRLCQEDQWIGISSFGFDLSVYDVFGALTCGASLYLHDKQENIYGMMEALRDFPITVWNTVPALMQLLVNELEEDSINPRLRLVLLSGDWIPVDLPGKIKKKFPNAQVISLGGATEASIWSIYYPIESVEPDWKSIPYGYPLANQTMYVLGYDLTPLPEHVVGDIYIGGLGLAMGYQNDPEKTRAAFLDHPLYGRLYATGDRGYFSSEGYMVFCGRKDSQVKIHGNRIELGEIESCLKKQDQVASAVAQVVSGSGNSKKLLAYYVPSDHGSYDAKWIKATADRQAEDLGLAQAQLPTHLTVEEYADLSEALERVSTAIIHNAFCRFSFFQKPGEIYSLEELFLRGQVVEKYSKLVGQWAEVIAKEGLIRKVGEGLYACISPLTETDVDGLYEEILQKKGVAYWGGSFEFLLLCNKNVLDILKADVNPLTILFPEGQTDRAQNIYRTNPVAEYMNQLTAQAIESYIQNWKKDRPVRILEFGAGTGGTTSAILERICNYKIEYTFTDLSTFFTEKAKKEFAAYDFIKYGIFNIDQLPQSQGYQPESFDIIIGANVLHDAGIIQKTLKHFRYLLAKEGMLAALEVTSNKIYHKVSIGFIEGFSGYKDERLQRNAPLLSAREWKAALETCGFIETMSYPLETSPAEAFDQHVILGYNAGQKNYKDKEELFAALRAELPSYMIPDQIYALYELPLSANGKVSLKDLPYEIGEETEGTSLLVRPTTKTQQLLHDIICETLGLEEISTDVNIFTVGADSLKSISVLTKLKNHHRDISLSTMYKYATIQQLADYMDHEVRTDSELLDEKRELADFKPDPEGRYEPFPLSDLQESYYIGAHETEGFHSIPTAGYVEIECPAYDHDRLFRVFEKVIERHDILRMYIDREGMQHVQKKLEDFTIPIQDMRGRSQEEIDDQLLQTRKEMVSTRLDLSKAPLFRCRLTQLADDFVILHIYADGQIMDGWSFQLFFTELGRFYKDPQLALPPLQVTFRDYIRYREALKTTKKYEADRDYWLNKIPSLPTAGTLPLERDITELESVEGIQVECGLPIEVWSQIEKQAMAHGVSAFSVLMTSFGLAVARWNDKRRFLLNIPEFYRPPFHEDIFQVLGECASFLLFTMEDCPEDTFYDKVVKTQQQIMELKDHNSFSGMEITREIYRRNNGYSEVLAPLVFGMLPDAQEFQQEFIEIQKEGMRIRYQENHTSQIWIDVNTCVYSDRIEFNYNSLKGLIRREVLEKLAQMQKEILFQAAYQEEYWNSRTEIPLPQEDRQIIDKANDTQTERRDLSIGQMLAESFHTYASRPYIRTLDRTYTYQDTYERVSRLVHHLRSLGISQGDKVAVYMGKSMEALVSALAICYMGAVYVPVEYTYSYDLALSALHWIHCQTLLVSEKDREALEGRIPHLVCVAPLLAQEEGNPEKPTLASPQEVEILATPPSVSPQEVGLIIHTSGTTGRPKAVMIRQESLLNAILATNQRYQVSCEDIAMGVTNLAHDMSLYDIFGMAQAGASLVIPDEMHAKDPEYWLDLMRQHPVTIWNSVPALQEMLLEAVGSQPKSASTLSSLRLLILGGDYIKPSLLRKIREYQPSLQLVSAGGPTETTLWNILHDVEERDLAEAVIPYGKPIANNRYYILNENMQEVPIGVTGTLYGAGIGVASGYCEDEALTQEKFVIWKGERLYHTGDRGHYREDGTILFDGREDRQVKINGKRIELSAISSVAEEGEEVGQAAALVNDRQQIILFYTGPKNEADAHTNVIRHRLEQRLPDYMIPKRFLYLEEIPMTRNGKTDLEELKRIYASLTEEKREQKPASQEGDALEELLKTRFCQLLNLEREEVNLDSDFFAMGGNSLIAMRLLSALRETFEAELTLTDLFTTSTIREMRDLLLERNAVIKSASSAAALSERR